MKTAAIILAAGFATRMQGACKPLLSLPVAENEHKEQSILERLINLYATVGCSPIFVVVGQHETQRITTEAQRFQHLGVQTITNPHAAQGMYSSLCCALQKLPSHTSFFVHPVDIPLVRHCTLTILQAAHDAHDHDILVPSFNDTQGHPPLIPYCHIPTLLAHDGTHGLRGILSTLPHKNIPTPDSLILHDMDTTHAYARLRDYAVHQHVLTPDEAIALLHCLHVRPQGIAHAHSVAAIATAFAKAYVHTHGPNRMNIPLTTSGALLHDMCKREPCHEHAAGQKLCSMGLPLLASLVDEHNDCHLEQSQPVREKHLVYMADKYVHGSSFVPVEQRFAQKLTLYAHDATASAAITARLHRAKAMEQRIAKEIQTNPAHLAYTAVKSATHTPSPTLHVPNI